MKNKELISLLQQFDEDCEVQCEYHNEESQQNLEGWELATIDSVELDSIKNTIKRLLIKIS